MPETTDEFDLWQSKPWWCQPWTIILTGIVLITGSWLVLKNLWITLPLTIAIIVWWTYFLVIVPRLLREMRSKD
jgi:membrane protein YdbS with pleckstrin-like domain